MALSSHVLWPVVCMQRHLSLLSPPCCHLINSLGVRQRNLGLQRRPGGALQSSTLGQIVPLIYLGFCTDMPPLHSVVSGGRMQQCPLKGGNWHRFGPQHVLSCQSSSTTESRRWLHARILQLKLLNFFLFSLQEQKERLFHNPLR